MICALEPDAPSSADGTANLICSISVSMFYADFSMSIIGLSLWRHRLRYCKYDQAHSAETSSEASLDSRNWYGHSVDDAWERADSHFQSENGLFLANGMERVL